jgi:hypothetical protein
LIPHKLKTALLWICLVGFPIAGFWAGQKHTEGTHHAKDLWSENRLGQLALALEFYHQEHGEFPPTKFQPKPDGPIHSWRVLLLPRVSNGRDANSNYDFTQEWSSSNNLHALNTVRRRNSIYRMIREPDGDIAHYLTIGEDDEWPTKWPLKSRLVKKGKDRFLLFENPDSDVHWMEPRY